MRYERFIKACPPGTTLRDRSSRRTPRQTLGSQQRGNKTETKLYLQNQFAPWSETWRSTAGAADLIKPVSIPANRGGLVFIGGNTSPSPPPIFVASCLFASLHPHDHVCASFSPVSSLPDSSPHSSLSSFVFCTLNFFFFLHSSAFLSLTFRAVFPASFPFPVPLIRPFTVKDNFTQNERENGSKVLLYLRCHHFSSLARWTAVISSSLFL